MGSLITGEGWIEWGGAPGILPALAALLLLATLAGALVARSARGGSRGRRGALVALRAAVAALLVFLVFQPVLVRPRMERSEQAVAVLHDDSLSMTVRDSTGQSRAERTAAALAAHATKFDGALAGRFHVLEYGFGAGPRPITSRDQLRRDARDTNLEDSIRRVAENLDSIDLSAVVLLSDGGPPRTLDPAAGDALASLGVPVYTVGVGEDEWRDLALGEVAVSRSFADQAPARVSAQFSASGLDGRKVVVEALLGEVVQASVEREIQGDQVEQQVQLDVIPRERDWLSFTVRARLADTTDATLDFVAENNRASALLDHREKRYRILYFAGRPNWQYKFVRHALAGDPELQLSGLIRVSGAEKTFVFQGRDASLGNPLFEGVKPEDELPRYDEAVFMRMGLAENELTDGYPTTAEALYPFHLIVWGDIEADFFAPVHMRLTRDAVAERGASFLLLGGPRTLGGSGYDGSIIETMLPVMPGEGGERIGGAARIAPSPEGFLSGIWGLRADRESSDSAWAALPPLPATDRLAAPRIGATVLGEAAPDDGGEAFPFLAQQAFGRGKSAALATGETWPWHMGTESDNTDHERLWRQLVRSLVGTVPDPVAFVATPGPRVAGDETTITWTVNNALFKPVEGATLTARVSGPGGETGVPLVERLEQPGTYDGPFTPTAPGLYRVTLEGGAAGGDALAPVTSAMLVESDLREYNGARFNPDALREIATLTGGQYFPLEALDEVAGAITAAEREHAAVTREPLWYHPFFYGLLAALLCAEWILRRRWGLA